MRHGLLENRFQIVEQVGKIPHGEVFRGSDLQSDLPVVIRMLRPEGSSSLELLQRFQQEANVLRNLNHPNAESVIGTGLTSNNEFYVVLEDVQGPTLTDVLRDNGPLPPERLANYLDQLASVLDAAHSRQIIHRDVRPENIKIATDEAGNEVVKLLGFAYAKSLHDTPEGGGVTQPGMVVGSPSYMSPEQASGKTVLKQSDIYSLGITLYELLTGQLPFQERTPVKLMVAHLRSPAPSFSQRNPQNTVSSSVESVVRQAIAKDYVERPRTVTELAQSFRSAIAANAPANALPVTLAVSSEPTERTKTRPAASSEAATQGAALSPLVIGLLVTAFLLIVALGVILAAVMRR